MKIFKCEHQEEYQIIIDGINQYNDSQVDRVLTKARYPIELVAKNELKEVIGGIFGYVDYYACFKINTLWVSEKIRGNNLGSKLLHKAEAIAKDLGAKIVVLDTFSFQAEDFYIKNGYQVFGRIEGHPNNSQELIFLNKKLT